VSPRGLPRFMHLCFVDVFTFSHTSRCLTCLVVPLPLPPLNPLPKLMNISSCLSSQGAFVPLPDMCVYVCVCVWLCRRGPFSNACIMYDPRCCVAGVCTRRRPLGCFSTCLRAVPLFAGLSLSLSLSHTHTHTSVTQMLVAFRLVFERCLCSQVSLSLSLSHTHTHITQVLDDSRLVFERCLCSQVSLSHTHTHTHIHHTNATLTQSAFVRRSRLTQLNPTRLTQLNPTRLTQLNPTKLTQPPSFLTCCLKEPLFADLIKLN
jgi:hypothetical protein